MFPSSYMFITSLILRKNYPMASSPILTVLEQSPVSPPPATVGDRVLPLTYFDFLWLNQPPVHNLFFYELSITESHFTDTIVPNLKHSLSITLQHFYPFAGNLIVFPTSTKKPEIRYVEGDSVMVTFAECNLDFNELTGNHPRDCEKFYHLIPYLGQAASTSDYVKIPLFSVQVTFFPNYGISIGMTNHHSLGDARTRFYFIKAWTSICQSGTDMLFLANGTLPFYDRVYKDEKLDESYLKFAKVETFNKEYQPPSLSGPIDKVRATFILSRTIIDKVRATFILSRTILDGLKKLVSTHLPTIPHVSSFTVACAYTWSCIAAAHGDELQLFGFPIDCRERMDPPVPAYFGNCIGGCMATEKASLLTGKEGFITAAKLLGESLHKILSDTGGIVKDIESYADVFSVGVPIKTFIGVAGTPKLKFYDMDFGWGKPKKIETISIDYGSSISMNACRESKQDLEIGISLSTTKMEAFVRAFNDGLKDIC